ncbi:ecto-ADP-ribosyltransferase 5-like isoform X2 [Hyperolius riggenbachi]|uniref:ecto-ADP-ribosyltransferase 5-like isoform X2 n=1 Tax=Hyperolius riggenbachi TaxID=752182 RepID=UPI0035A2FC3C
MEASARGYLSLQVRDFLMMPVLVSGFCLYLGLLINKQVGGQRVQLGMYENSLDDQYVGCLEKMESLAPGLLKAERQVNVDLDSAWLHANETWLTRKSSIKVLPAGFTDEHGIALLVYTNMNISIYKQLNNAVREYGTDPKAFALHSLHFYLTRALTLLQTRCDGKPWHTYRGSSRIVFEPPPNPGDLIRLSQFASSSTDVKQAELFGTVSFFNITTCFGADIHNFSYFPSQKEVLIPVDEVFHIDKYVKEGNRFVLQSTNKRCSFYNCAYLGGSKRQNCTYNSAPGGLQIINAVTAPLLVGLSIVFLTR